MTTKEKQLLKSFLTKEIEHRINNMSGDETRDEVTKKFDLGRVAASEWHWIKSSV